MNADEIETIRDALESIAEAFDSLQTGDTFAGYDSIADCIRSTMPDKDSGKAYTRAERLRLIRIAQIYAQEPYRDTDNALEAVCMALEIIHDEPYSWHMLRGCCQGDWQYIIMPEALADTRDVYEIEYFNLGEEWIVNDDFCVYVYKDARQEIADAAGCCPEELRLLAFDGYEMAAKYREAEA